MGATIRTLGLFAFMFGLFMVIGWLVGSLFIGNWVLGAIMFLVLAGLINLISYFYSSKIVLWSYRVRLVSEAEAPRLYRIVRNIAAMNGMPMPKVGIIPTSNPNAFATGRNPKNAVVCATEGIMRLLDDEELSGVMAHEMAHVKNRDILVMSVASTIAGAISFAARFAFYGALFNGRRNEGGMIIALVVAITAPIAAMIVQLAISRNREYKADAEGAKLIGRPLYLARALEKLETANKRDPIRFGNPSSSNMFIVNPFRGGGLATIFMTHPPMNERIKRLRQMANKMGQF
ncbi:MAG: heat shock protein HtpX [Methanomassiliicoccales archaeon PtaB.Bin134]|nr:MAG: heat shock protein HtpX [Methanomassiliicoccales archaeon PtaB.Bin134]